MTSAYANGSAKAAYSSSSATTTALSRWSIAGKQLPAVDKIKALHIYDFDNTRQCSLPVCYPFAPLMLTQPPPLL